MRGDMAGAQIRGTRPVFQQDGEEAIFWLHDGFPLDIGQGQAMPAQSRPEWIASQGGAVNMQGADWQDLRLFLVLTRAGSYAAAGREAGLHETTLARRIARLERGVGAPLWLPAPSGGSVTAEGRALAERIARAATELSAAGQGVPATRVRLSAVPWMAVLIAEHLAGLAAAHPELLLDIEADQTPRDPMRGETDLALRFARPEGPGDLSARRLCDVGFGAFAMPGAEAAPWIGYVDAYAHLPQANWHGDGTEGHRVADLATARALVAAGQGRGYLPLALAPEGAVRLPGVGARPLWLLMHPRLRTWPCLRVAVGWIETEIAPLLTGSAGGRA
jgi:DNA-binding transcriptional LysR family regulator